MHEVLPHTAYRRSSLGGMHGVFEYDGSGQPFQTEVVTRADDQLESVAPAPVAVPFGEQQRHAFVYVTVELGEAACRVAVAKVLTPSPKELVELAYSRWVGMWRRLRLVESRIRDRARSIALALGQHAG